MKTALCLYGYFNNKTDLNAGFKGLKYINDTILSKLDDVTIFGHSWDMKNLKNIHDSYNFQDITIEKQINFNKISEKHGLSQSKIDTGFNRQSSSYKTCAIDRTLSFLYSRSKSINKALIHDKYDCIIACRFDLGHRSQMHRGYNVSLMNFDPEHNMDYIYSSMWVQLNAGYADQWFYSNPENMEKLSNMYEKTLNDYFHLGNDYHKALITGWPDSNRLDEFSNEMLKENKTNDLHKYPQWQMINNHILHKWHFIECGLYEKSKFI